MIAAMDQSVQEKVLRATFDGYIFLRLRVNILIGDSKQSIDYYFQGGSYRKPFFHYS